MNEQPSLSVITRMQNWVGRLFGRNLREPISGAPILPLKGLQRIGSDYGGWTIPLRLLRPESICYCAGAGEDITFDLALVEVFRCQVFSYDPTPRAIHYVEKVAGEIPQ